VTSKSGQIWNQLTPKQRADLIYVAEVDIAELIGALEDTAEDEAAINEAERRAGIAAKGGRRAPKGKGSTLVKRGLVKLVSHDYTAHYALTPLGRSVVKHAERLMRAGSARAPYPLSQHKSPAQLDAEIAETLAKAGR